MVSRLYASTRSLWQQVETAVATLDVGRGRPRRVVEVMALYVTGLILLEKGQTGVRIATVLPGRAHDALNRLLRVLPWSPDQLILGLVRWVQRQTGPGYLCLDDVVVEKPFAKLLTWAGWTYSHSKRGHVFGFHVVLLFWCNKTLRIPVGFRLWRAKREGTAPYRTKLELAQSLISNVLRAGLTFEYLTFDLWYNARSFTKWLNEQEIIWVSTLKGNALITYCGRTQSVEKWAQQLPRHRIAGRTWAWERHVALVLLAFVVLQQLRLAPSETVGEVKRRLHLSVIRGDESMSGVAIASPAEGKIMAVA